uniref:Uncharacterized protein n=1 Tax=viral metagenome TaxID=1070528 RepID=A0A6H1ZP93_9ZZZZ
MDVLAALVIGAVPAQYIALAALVVVLVELKELKRRVGRIETRMNERK